MAVTIVDADTYIELNVIVIDDWTGSDEAKKTRLLNVALSTLTRVYAQYTIPDEAVYEYAAVLSVAFNDTNVQKQNGVKQFSVAGISYMFDGGKDTVESLIPSVSIDLISKANGVTLGGAGRKRVKWTVL
jgi:L-cysteine desulfidase